MVKSEAKTPQPAEYTAALLPKVESKKKRWEKRKKKNPIAISHDPDGNPIVPTAVRPSSRTVPVEVGLESPVVDLPKSIEQIVPSNERATTVPAEVGLGSPVVDAAKCVDSIVPTPQPEQHAAALVREAAPKKKRWEKKKKKNPKTISLDPIVQTAVSGGEQSTGTVPVEVGENPVVDLPKSIEQIGPSPIVLRNETEITVPVEVGLGNPVLDAAKCIAPSPADAATLLPEAEPKKKRWEKRKKKNPIAVSLDADGNPIVDSQKSVEIIVPTPQPAEPAAALLPIAEPEKKRWEKRKRKNPIAVSLDADGNPIVDSQKSVEIIVPTPQPAEHTAALLPGAEPKKKRWEKKKKKNPIAVSLDADGNPIVDSQKAVDIKEQALQPEPEPTVPTAVLVEVGLDNPVVDLPKSIEQTVPSEEKAITVPGLGNPVVDAEKCIEAIVPSKKSKTTVPGLENPVADAPQAEQTGLIPKPEPIVPVTVPSTTTVPVEVGLGNPVVDAPKSIEAIVPSKKRKRKKSKTTVPVEVGLENPVADAPQSIEVEQAGLVPNPEPVVSTTDPSTTTVHVQGGLENPVVDLPKCIEVEQAGVLLKPKPVVPSTVPSKKRKRKKSTDTVPIEVGLENTVVDAPKPIEVEQVGLVPNPEPIVPATVPSTTTFPVQGGLENPVVDLPKCIEGIVWIPTVPCKKKKKKKKKGTATVPVVGLENPVADAPKPIEGEHAGLIPNPEPVLATVPSKNKKKKNNDTSTFPIDVEAQKYVEICVLCRKRGHSIPTCPELNNLNVNSEGPKLQKKKKMKLPPMPWGKRKKKKYKKKKSSGKED